MTREETIIAHRKIFDVQLRGTDIIGITEYLDKVICSQEFDENTKNHARSIISTIHMQTRKMLYEYKNVIPIQPYLESIN